jgi:arginase family enzyme
MASRSINIISVPSDVGSVYAGKSRAPAAFETAGLEDKLGAAGWQTTASTALPQGPVGWTSSTRQPNGARNEVETVKACNQVREAVGNALAASDTGSGHPPPFQLILAGECLYCPAILSAYWEHLKGTMKRIGIVYIDADCDLYTPSEPTSSGNIAGMTLTHLTLREGALESMRGFCRPDGAGVVDNTNILLFGLNIDAPANKREHLGFLFDHGFRVTTSQSVQRDPIKEAKSALEWMEDNVDYIFVHLDVDVIDPGLYPLGNVPNWTGLSFEATMAALKTFLGSGKVVGLSIAEVNPDHDPGLRMTSQLVDNIVDGLGGWRASGGFAE